MVVGDETDLGKARVVGIVAVVAHDEVMAGGNLPCPRRAATAGGDMENFIGTTLRQGLPVTNIGLRITVGIRLVLGKSLFSDGLTVDGQTGTGNGDLIAG